MPFLDLNGPLPIAAIDAAMGFPSDAKGGAEKREAFYGFQLRRYAQYRLSQGDRDLPELLQIALDRPVEPPKTRRQRRAGQISGEIFKIYKGLINTNPNMASWYNAIAAIQPILRDAGLPYSDSYLWEVIREFRPAMHLWTARNLRERRFVQGGDDPFSIHEDLDCLILEAEILRSWGENWRGMYDKSEPPLAGENWRPPLDWTPRQRHGDWPKDAGRVPHYSLTTEMIGSVRPKGRPTQAS